MAEQKKFYSRCSFGVSKVGDVSVVAGTVDGRISSKGVVTGTGTNGKKYAKFILSLQNQKKNMNYWAGILGAKETDLLSNTADNGSEYTTLNVFVSERDAEYAEKNLNAGDVVDVVGFLKVSEKDDKRYVTLYANASGIKLVRKSDKPAGAPAADTTPSKTSPEGSYTPENVDIDEDDLPF